MSESRRQQKFSKLIQSELSDIFFREVGEMFNNAMVTITRVSVTPDFGIARVHLSIMTPEEKKSIFERLEKNTAEVRRRLGNRIRKQARKVPELQFFLDDGAENANHIQQVLNNLDIPEAPEEPKDN